MPITFLVDHSALQHLSGLEQTALGGVIIALLGLVYFLVRKVVGLANHHSTELKEVIVGNTTAITQLGSNLATNTRVSERLERWLEKRG
jgi:hypothetical protein